MSNHTCTASLCIRKSRDVKSPVGYKIESACRLKDSIECPHKRKPKRI